MKCYIIIFALLTCFALICSGQETITETDSVKITQDSTSLSRHDLDEAILKNVYSELLDVDKQIRLTHNMLVGLSSKEMKNYNKSIEKQKALYMQRISAESSCVLPVKIGENEGAPG